MHAASPWLVNNRVIDSGSSPVFRPNLSPTVSSVRPWFHFFSFDIHFARVSSFQLRLHQQTYWEMFRVLTPADISELLRASFELDLYFPLVLRHRTWTLTQAGPLWSASYSYFKLVMLVRAFGYILPYKYPLLTVLAWSPNTILLTKLNSKFFFGRGAVDLPLTKLRLTSPWSSLLVHALSMGD